MVVKFTKTAPKFYRSEDRRFSVVESTWRTGERGYRRTVRTFVLFDGDVRVESFLSLDAATRAAEKRVAS